MNNTLYSSRFKIIITASLLVCMMFVTLLASSPVQTVSAETSQLPPTKRTMNVSGQGTVKATPDIAYVSLGVVTEHTNAKTAQQDNAKAMDKIVTAIKAAGIAESDIKSVNYSIYPKYNYNQRTGTSSIDGYTVNNSIQVTVRDIKKTGNIIDLASTNGANISSQISFGLSDYEKYYNEALKNAVEIAKKRASTMAGALGIKLDVPVSVSENGGYSPVYSYNSYGAYEARAAMEDAATTPVSAGSMEIRASVNMTYEY